MVLSKINKKFNYYFFKIISLKYLNGFIIGREKMKKKGVSGKWRGSINKSSDPESPTVDLQHPIEYIP